MCYTKISPSKTSDGYVIAQMLIFTTPTNIQRIFSIPSSIKSQSTHYRMWIIVSTERGINNSGPFYKHGLTLIPAWISNYIHYNMWDEITYPFLNFNGATVEV